MKVHPHYHGKKPLIYTSSTRTRRGGSCLKDIYKTFLIYRTCMRRAPAKPVRACTLRKWCPVSNVTFQAPLRTSHSTLHTSHCTLRTPHFTLHTALFALQTSHSTLHTSHFSLLTPHFTLHTSHSTLYTPRFTLLTAFFRLHTSYFTLYMSQSTLHTSHCFLHTPHFFTPQRSFYTQQAFTHSKHVHTKHLHTVLLHMESAYTHTHTQKLFLHRDAFTHREAFTHTNFYTQALQLQNRISTPKQKKDDFDALFKRIFKRKIISAKMEKIC